ncbi:MAG: single-stranded-DNA-specific exonuclease RecJ [Planctomycetes bacterium]|nr:single-stranded-DNA-specific exonuclease RecJ [Planctomycetota bacterium]
MPQTVLASLYRWNIQPEAPALRDRLASELRLQSITAQLLVNRGLESPGEGAEILKPTLQSLPDPTRLPGFQAAVDAIQQHLQDEKSGPILIHGDYDVDGICGSTLLMHLLTMLGADVHVFLPDRVRDGYSFGQNSLNHIAKIGAKLVIAVDNGTTAVAPLTELAELGVQVIVVDHHLPGKELPPCTALVNPWMAPKEDELFPYFCGAGVAYLLAWGLLRHLNGDGQLPEHQRRFLLQSLAFAAIATIADSMPLKGPNRAIVRRGLEVLPTSTFAGLSALCKLLKLQSPTASDIGFRIAPHLNAAGRMGRTELAFELLSCTEPARAAQLAEQLQGLNRERQDVQHRQQAALAPQVEAQRQRGEHVLFAGESEAAFGVLGIVAARFHEDSGLPTLLWAECEPGVARGSGRGPEGVHLVKLMDQVSPYLHGYGGHAQAAGFHFDPANVDALADALSSAAAKLPAPPQPELCIDAEVQPQELNLATVDEFNLLEPFGSGFKSPLFLCTQTTLCAQPSPLGADGRHVALRLEKNGYVIRALGWSMAERLSHLAAETTVDVVFEANINSFRGPRRVEWTIRDIRSVAKNDTP